MGFIVIYCSYILTNAQTPNRRRRNKVLRVIDSRKVRRPVQIKTKYTKYDLKSDSLVNDGVFMRRVFLVS